MAMTAVPSRVKNGGGKEATGRLALGDDVARRGVEEPHVAPHVGQQAAVRTERDAGILAVVVADPDALPALCVEHLEPGG